MSGYINCGISIAQSCLTLCDPIDCSLPGSSVHGIFQASLLEWVAISFSRGSSRPRDWTRVSCIVGRHFTVWTTREAQIIYYSMLKRNKLSSGRTQLVDTETTWVHLCMWFTRVTFTFCASLCWDGPAATRTPSVKTLVSDSHCSVKGRKTPW